MIGGAASKVGGSLLGSATGQGIGEVIGEKISSVLGSLLGSVVGQAGGATANAAALSVATTLINVNADANTLVITAAIAESAITIAGAVTAGSLNPEVAGFKLSGGGIIPGFAGGGLVGGGSLAILHPREMVLPAPISLGIQDMIARGNSGGNNSGGNTLNYNANVTGYHPFESKGAFEGLLRSHGDVLMRHLENAVRNGWSPA